MAGTATLALLLLPMVIRASREALRTIPLSLREACSALGAERWQAIRQMYLVVQDAIHAHPDQTGSLIHMLSASRHLERIADHATNIAEDVIYMIEGVIVRHKTEEYQAQAFR